MILVIAAIIPIILLCFFVYAKDKNKEPFGLLVGIFLLGFVTVFPVLICELVFGAVFPMDQTAGFIPIFLNVLFGVAFVEEGFKWLVTKFLGYNNKAFDEVYDIIVYSVFSSLGFACFENICYVLQNGLGNAILRALLAVPGHTCFAIAMGYFFSKAKVNQINGNKALHNRNMVLSIVAPILLHTTYDALLFNMGDITTIGDMVIQIVPFIIFYSAMVIVCFITVDKTAKIQQNLTININNGNIGRDSQGYLYYNYANPTTPIMGVTNANVVTNSTPAPVFSTPVTNSNVTPVVTSHNMDKTFYDMPVITQSAPFDGTSSTVNTQASPAAVGVSAQTPGVVPPTHCPICGHPTNGKNFCSRCGFRLK